MSSSLKRIVIEKETHARSDRWYKIKKKCHPSLSRNTSRHNYVVLGYLWERVSRHSHRRIICSYFKQMLCHDYMAFSCACQSLLIFNRFFRPIFVLGSLKGKINLIQTIVTSILTRRLEKAFLVSSWSEMVTDCKVKDVHIHAFSFWQLYWWSTAHVESGLRWQTSMLI